MRFNIKLFNYKRLYIHFCLLALLNIFFSTENIKAKLGQANTALIGLLDRIRMLDNDLIRLRSKLNTVLEIQENEQRNDKSKESKRISKTSKE